MIEGKGNAMHRTTLLCSQTAAQQDRPARKNDKKS
jgi:hypothetical protein